MFEPIGPNIARTIVGDDYNPDFRYELETTDECLRLVVTNKETGEVSYKDLTDTNTPSHHVDPLYDDERLDSMRNYKRRGLTGASLAILLLCVVVVVCCVAAVMIAPK